MPCRSDYMNPSPIEIEASDLYMLLDELKTGVPVISDDFNKGYDKRSYMRGPTKHDVDILTAKLCNILKHTTHITDYSLELQIWYRNHKFSDARRKAKVAGKKKDDRNRKKALEKLTLQEKKLLGLI